MSTEAKRRRWPWVLLTLAALLALAFWFLPFAYIGDMRVERATVLNPGEPDGSTKEDELATPKRLVVTFSTGSDLAHVRQSKGIGIIYAALSDCDTKAKTSELITQRDGY